MINFASLFGSFNRNTNSAINDVLERHSNLVNTKPTVTPEQQSSRSLSTLEQLMDIDSFVNQYKSSNSKLLEFLQYSQYVQILDYITKVGPQNDQKRGYKYPMVAADLLTALGQGTSGNGNDSSSKDRPSQQLIDLMLPDDGSKKVDILTYYESQEEYQSEEQVQDQEQEEHKESVSHKSALQKNQGQQAQQGKTNNNDDENGDNLAEKPQEKMENQTSASTMVTQTPQVVVTVEKAKVMVKKSRKVRKSRLQSHEPLLTHLMKYFQGPINYTLAGYVCKVLTAVFTKKPLSFYQYIFGLTDTSNTTQNPDKSPKQRLYSHLICDHIQSRSVGDLMFKILTFDSLQLPEAINQKRSDLYNHIIKLLGVVNVQQPHIISNVAYTLHEIIQKTSVYIKNGNAGVPSTGAISAPIPSVVAAFLEIFYQPQTIYKVLENTINQNQTIAGYSCMVLHSYLHHTELETLHSFKLQEVLEEFITKACDRLRDVVDKKPSPKQVGMGRIKLVEILGFLVRKPKKTNKTDKTGAIQEQSNSKSDNTTLSSQLLQQLYIHELIANKHPDFFSILFNLLKAFPNNNILHNEVYKIVESVLLQRPSHKSALQQLLLSPGKQLLDWLIYEAKDDLEIRQKLQLKHEQQKNKSVGKTQIVSGIASKRKGYIGHVINISKTIIELYENGTSTKIDAESSEQSMQLVSHIYKDSTFQNQVVTNLIKPTKTLNDRSLAGYEMKKDKINHDIMFQKEDILAAYSGFLSNCPSAIYEEEQVVEPQNKNKQPQQHVIKDDDQQADKQQSKQSQGQKMSQQNQENSSKQNNTPSPQDVVQTTELTQQEQQIDETKFNEVVAVAEELSEAEPKYWINHINYDLQQLLTDIL